MDKYYYDVLVKRGIITSYERVNDAKRQLQGIDVILYYPGGNIKIDEKAQLHYINKELPTQSFELEFINRSNNIATGWFLQDDLSTDYYFILTVSAENGTSVDNFSVNKVTGVNGILIEKAKLKEFLNKNNISEDTMRRVAAEIRQEETRYRPAGLLEMRYVWSPKYRESPVNLVIPKTVLCSVEGTNHIMITKEDVTAAL